MIGSGSSSGADLVRIGQGIKGVEMLMREVPFVYMVEFFEIVLVIDTVGKGLL